MITIRRSTERGHAHHGWLDTFHTFSFANYFDPEWMGYSVLRVINQDRVTAGSGFGTHGHRDMEIVTYMIEGTLEHKDSMGNGSKMGPGEVQLMSAGSGVTHSEFNASKTEGLHLLQMWVLPRTKGTAPRYEQRLFSREDRKGRLRLLVHPEGKDGALTIGQNASLHAALLDPSEEVRHALLPDRCAWVHVAIGRATLNGHALGPGDAAAVEDESEVTIRGDQPADIVLWDLPRIPARP